MRFRAHGHAKPVVAMIDVWLILGDSEAAQGGTMSVLPNFVPPPVGANKLYMVSQQDLTTVSELSLPSGTSTGTWSLAAPFLWYRWRQTGRKQMVCDCAKSGTDSTYYFFSADHSTPSGYWRAVASMTAALAQPLTQWAGIVIVGGANDGSLATPHWDTNWTQAISDIETGLGKSAPVILYSKQPPGPPIAPYSTSWSTVRTQQDGWAGGRKVEITPDNTGPWSDIQYVHRDSQGLDNLASLICTTQYGAIPAIPSVDPSTIANLLYRFESDGTLTQGGGVVTDWTDAVSGTVKLAASGTAKPAYAASDANWNNKPTITWDATNDLMQANNASSAWALCSDGSGCTIFGVFNATGGNVDLFSTNMGNAPGGLLLRLTGGYIQGYVSKASGFSTYVDPNVLKVAAPTGKRTFFTYRMQTGLCSLRHRGSKWVTTSATTGSPAVGCEYAAKLGAGYYFGGVTMPALLVFSRYLTDQECDDVGNYLSVKYGLEAWA